MPLFCMTSAEVQQGCHAGWLDLHSHRLPTASSSSCWACSPAASAQCLIILLLSLFPSSLCSCHRCTGSACPAPVLLSLSCLCTHIFCQRESWNTAGWYTTHPYCRDTAVAGGGWFILCISPILDFALQYIFSEGFTAVMAALYWLDLLNCC